MSGTAVVKNYAETLLELAVRAEAVEEYTRWIDEIAAFHRSEPDFRRFLETPRIGLEEKKAALRRALGEEAPEDFVRFLLVVLDKRRQGLLGRIGQSFHDLLDEREGRVHATVTLAREPDEELRELIETGLERSTGRDVVPHFRTDEDVVGGVVVRVGDTVMDGSLRRRLSDLKRELLASETARG